MLPEEFGVLARAASYVEERGRAGHDLIDYGSQAVGFAGVCFRNVRGVLLPLMSVLCGVVWTMGIMVLAGEAITIGTMVLPSLLIVIGSTYSIYIIAQYEDEIQKGGTAAEVVLRALTRVTVPVTVAAFTTVVGFVTLLVNRIGTIRALGLYATVGFACLTVVVLTLMPAVLTLLPLPQRRVARKGSDRLDGLLAQVGHFDHQYRVPIMVAAALLIIPCVWGVSRIRADSNVIQYFKESSPVRRAHKRNIEGVRRNILNWLNDVFQARPQLEAPLET